MIFLCEITRLGFLQYISISPIDCLHRNLYIDWILDETVGAFYFFFSPLAMPLFKGGAYTTTIPLF
jgi:hypothetical protein